MVRTQIYLTEQQRDELAAMAQTKGINQSELIRQAIDSFIDQAGESHRQAVLAKAAGLWKGRDDLPDFETARANWDRR